MSLPDMCRFMFKNLQNVTAFKGFFWNNYIREERKGGCSISDKTTLGNLVFCIVPFLIIINVRATLDNIRNKKRPVIEK